MCVAIISQLCVVQKQKKQYGALKIVILGFDLVEVRLVEIVIDLIII